MFHFIYKPFEKTDHLLNFLRGMIFAFVILLAIPGFAQKLRFDHLSVKQGLSQANVSDIMQDKFGFIWIGTEDGLNLYDGYKITVFRNNPEDTTSLTTNSITCFVQDEDGNLWIGTNNGLNYYNRTLNHFTRFRSNPNDPESLPGNNITSIHIDPKKQLWIGQGGNLLLFNFENKKFKRFTHDQNNPKSLVAGNMESILTDRYNRLWVGSNGGGLSMLNAGSENFTNYTHDPSNPASINSNGVKCLFQDNEGIMWIGTSGGGLSRFDIEKRTFTQYNHDPNNPSSIASHLIRGVTGDKQGQLWVSTDGSLNLMNKKEGTFTRFYNEPNDEKSMSSNVAVKVIFDSNDRMWVGTRNGGVSIYDKDRYLFELYKHNANDINSLNYNNTTSFSEDSKGNIWVGTDGGGASYLDRKTGRFTALVHDPKDKYSLSTNKVLAICTDNEDGVWIGMWEGGGVNYYDHVSKKVKRYVSDPNNPRTVSDTRFFKIFKDRKGTIWMGSFGYGLNKYNRDTDDFTRYPLSDGSQTPITQSSINDMVDDDLGNIWIATQGGLFKFDPQREVFTRYQSGTQTGLSSNGILSVLIDSKKRLWVGTDAGVNLFDLENKTTKVYKKRDGLPNEVILGLLEDKEHNLWLSTNRGLCKLNPDSLAIKVYDDTYGLQDNQFNRWSYKGLSTGELIFGGSNGFNLFNPQNIRDNPFKPSVYITDIKLFNKPVPIGENEVLKQSIMFTKELSLQYYQNFFTFEFTALSYRQTEKNQYKYILEGFDDDWVESGTERRASYTNIDPGEYIFKVIASNNDGVWNTEGSLIKITIVPPFWKTSWFIGLLVITTGAGIYSMIRYQRNKTIRQKEELHAIIEKQTREVKKQNEEILTKSEQEKAQNWIIQGIAHFGGIMSKHKGDLEGLSNEILTNLVKYVNAQQGCVAVAVTDEANSDVYLEIMATYALSAKDKGKFSRIEVGEGLLGATFKDKEKKYITNVPANYGNIESGLGQINAPRLLLLPLKTDMDIYGVIELAFLEDVTDTVQEFLDKLSDVIALNINAANLNYKTQILLQHSKEQTEELRAQEEEMRQTMEEMEATQEGQRRREEAMQQKIDELEKKLR